MSWSHPKAECMLSKYFKTTIRSIRKDWRYSLLNIFGLAVGLASTALIFLWVEDELTFNHNFSRHDNLYHVLQNGKSDAGISTNSSTPGPLANALKTEIAGIINSGRLSWDMDQLAIVGEKTVKESGMYADPSIISMLTLPFINGDPKTALNNKNDIVISESMSKALFGDHNPLGQVVKMNAKAAYSVDGLYRVTGVYKNLPQNCSYHFQWLSPYTTWEDANDWLKPWTNNLTETIVEVSPAANVESINQKLKNYLATKITGSSNQCFLFNMNNWHLRNKFVNGVQDGGNIQYVKLFSTVAIIILLIACINFMNLSTARSEQRAKEIGVLKVMGADKRELIGKFISESLLMSFIALILSLCLLQIVLPFFNQLIQRNLSLNIFTPFHGIGFLAVALVAGLIAGSYPAFYLSSFNPIIVLKGLKQQIPVSVIFIRKGLVIAQFTASVILIIATLIVYKQIQHVKNRNLGYNKSNLVYINLSGTMKDHFGEIKNTLVATGLVENAAISLHDALHVYSSGDGFQWEGKNPNSKITVHTNVVSSDYIPTMNMQLAAGRNFFDNITADTTHVIINESMAKIMGASGKVGGIISGDKFRFVIIGIIKDFIYNDIYGGGQPLLFFNGNYAATVMAVRLKPNVNTPQALDSIHDILKKENPGGSFDYHFADKDFYEMFSSETLIGTLAAVFASLAIFISCLGLFGLAAYTAERRTKEISIRKLLGASINVLTGLLVKEFLQLITISLIVAFPIAWWCMHNWLQDYEYRTSMSWWIFGLAGISVLLIALITISFQSIKTAIINPARALRTE